MLVLIRKLLYHLQAWIYVLENGSKNVNHKVPLVLIAVGKLLKHFEPRVEHRSVNET